MTHKIETRPLNTLKANPLNPKAHDEKLLHKSLNAFGYVEPIVIDGRTDYMISGHGRAQVLQELYNEGAEPPEGVTVKNKQWMVPVVTGWASRDDTEANAVLVALNRTTERGGWNDENLLEILQQLSETDTLDLAGYVETDIALLQRIVEAQDVFTEDITTAIDEFLDDNDIEKEKVGVQYSSVLRVYFQTEDARESFFQEIGYENTKGQKTIRYPKTFQRQAAEKWQG